MKPNDLRDILDQILHPIRMRIANTLARAIVSLVSDDTKLQRLQLGVLKNEDADDPERFQQYGFSSVPQVGAEALVMFPNGDRSFPLVIAVDDRRFRPTGKPAGEVALYSDEGDEVRLARSNRVQVKAAGTVAIGSDPDVTAANPLAGVATGQSVDGWGMPLHLVSTKVFADNG